MSEEPSMLELLEGKKVLFVDDKLEFHRDDICELGQYGLEVSTCETAFDIPERLDNAPSAFALVITDLMGMTKDSRTFVPRRDLQPIIERYPEIPFLIYSLENQSILQYEDKGARAYVWKEDGVEELINALLHILIQKKESFYLSKSLRSAKRLSLQERKVLQYAAQDGLASKEIAQKLGLSKHTVSSYLKDIREKLEAKDTKHAIVIAYEKGLI